MDKCVEFNFNDKKSIYYNVANFDVETIRSLPSYHDKWVFIRLLNCGKERIYNDLAALQLPKRFIAKVIYWGKKVSYSRVKQVVGKDLKYEEMLKLMNISAGNSFVRYKDEYDEDEFRRYYDDTHYCLFTLPNTFEAFILEEDNTITIEEFDPLVKLNYNSFLSAIQTNSIAGEVYMEQHKFELRLFEKFFSVLLLSQPHLSCSDDIFKMIFESCTFHFENFFNTLEDINNFLDICDYVYGLSKKDKKMLKNYRVFVNEYYRNLGYGEEPKI